MNNFHKRYDKELATPFPNRDETKLDVVKRKNKAILAFFSKVDMDICLIGDPQKPKIIVNKYYCLSAFVDNFNIHFTDAQYNGKVVKTFKLKNGEKISHSEFLKFFSSHTQRRVYKIRYADTQLYLAGYNFKDRDTLTGKYPVFSDVNFKIYTSEQSIREIIEDFKEYPLEIE